MTFGCRSLAALCAPLAASMAPKVLLPLNGQLVCVRDGVVILHDLAADGAGVALPLQHW